MHTPSDYTIKPDTLSGKIVLVTGAEPPHHCQRLCNGTLALSAPDGICFMLTLVG